MLNGMNIMTDKEIIIENVKLLATTKFVKRYMRDGCNYSMYCDCNKCKNESWYDDDYCNNERLHFIDNDTKTIRVYCENYKNKKDI